MLGKPLQAALVFGIVVVSFALFLSQAGNFFGQAGHGGAHITGTIVLLDDLKYFGVTIGGITREVLNQEVKSSVALPGSAASTCNVSISGCCSVWASSSSMSVSMGTGAGAPTGSSSTATCLTAAGTLSGGTVHEASLNCGSMTASHLSVAYVCPI